MNPQEMVRVQNYLRKVFGAKTLSVRARPKIKDSAEVYVGEDFVGTLTLDNEDGEICYQFQMAILELDLEELIRRHGPMASTSSTARASRSRPTDRCWVADNAIVIGKVTSCARTPASGSAACCAATTSRS